MSRKASGDWNKGQILGYLKKNTFEISQSLEHLQKFFDFCIRNNQKSLAGGEHNYA